MFSQVDQKPNKKAQTLCLALLLLCVLCPPLKAQTIPTQDQPETLAPLKVAIWPSPAGYKDDKGVTRWIRPEFFVTIANLMGRQVEFIHMTYLRAVHELKTGRIDMMDGVNVPSTYIRLPPETITSLTPYFTRPISLYSIVDRGFEIKTRDEAKRYQLGSVRLTSTEQRTPWLGQDNTHYFEDADKLIKALLAKRVDLATLAPIGAASISKQLGVKLSRVFDYSRLESFSLFSPVSPRIRNPLTFCQDFIAAQIKIVGSGRYQAILKANNMASLLPYYNQDYSPSCRIVPTE